MKWILVLIFCVGISGEICFADKEGHILLYTGYGTPRKVIVFGRAVEDRPPTIPESGSKLGNMFRTIRMLDTDELVGKTVTAQVSGQKAEAVTDNDGFFSIGFNSGREPFKVGELPVRVTLQVSQRNCVEMDGVALVYPETISRVVVSDFDDSLIYTGVDKKSLKLLVKVATWDPSRMKPVEGMRDLLNALVRQKGNEAKPSAVVFYISGGPVNFYPRILAFLEKEAYPRGPLLLRNWGTNNEGELETTVRFKTSKIEELMGLFKSGKFILIGDNTENDPEIYAGLREKHPDRVEAIMIRKVEEKEERNGRFNDMDLICDGCEALRIAKEKGIIEDGEIKRKTP